MNKLRSKLMNGHQDLADRYGSNDPLVLDLQAEIDRFAQSTTDMTTVDRREVNALEQAWSRHSEIASL